MKFYVYTDVELRANERVVHKYDDAVDDGTKSHRNNHEACL